MLCLVTPLVLTSKLLKRDIIFFKVANLHIWVVGTTKYFYNITNIATNNTVYIYMDFIIIFCLRKIKTVSSN